MGAHPSHVLTHSKRSLASAQQHQYHDVLATSMLLRSGSTAYKSALRIKLNDQMMLGAAHMRADRSAHLKHSLSMALARLPSPIRSNASVTPSTRHSLAEIFGSLLGGRSSPASC